MNKEKRNAYENLAGKLEGKWRGHGWENIRNYLREIVCGSVRTRLIRVKIYASGGLHNMLQNF
jgi:hypothetical protein